MANADLINSGDAMKLFGVKSKSVLYRLERAGLIHPLRMGKQSLRYRKSELEAFIILNTGGKADDLGQSTTEVT